MSLIRFGEFSAEPRTQELWRDGRRVRLPRQSFQILVALTRAPGELVTREALQSQLWPATTQVEYEQGLNAAINRLREALGDSAAQPKYIETLPRLGYRFIGKLEPAPTLTPESTPTSAPTPALTTTASPEPPPAQSAPRAPGRATWRPFTIGALGAIALAGAVLWIRQPKPLTNYGAPRPVTALAGEERAPSLSPDGSRVVFAWNGDPSTNGKYDLFVKSLDSETLLRLTTLPSDALSPAWSPDGNSIAFVRKLAGQDGVYLVPALGGAERKLAAAALADQPFLQLAWSPDGKRIAFSAYAAGLHTIRFVDVKTLTVTSLPQAPACWHTGLPAYTADGERLAFVCTSSVGVYSVYIARLDGTKPEGLGSTLGVPTGLAWDVDEDALILSNDSGEGGGLRQSTLRPRDGTRAHFGELGSSPSRAGNKIVYVRGSQPVEIWRMDLTAPDPAATAKPLIVSTRVESTPDYSADQQRIVFQSNRTGSTEIWMADAEGGNAAKLTDFKRPLTGAPRWCADGKRVVLDSRDAMNSSVYVLDIEEKLPRRVDAGDVQLSLPVFSRDCAWILASDGRDRIYKLPAAGGTPRPFTGQAAYLVQVAGDRAVFNVKRDDGVTLWSKPVDGGEEAALAGMPPLGYNDAWAVTTNGVYFTRESQGSTELHFYDLRSRAVRRIAPLPKPPAPGGGLGLSVSRDGHWLLYSQAGEAESDIMLVTGERAN